MAEITRKRTGEFLLTIFKQLNQRPDGMPARDALKLVADTMILTPYELGEFDSGGKRFEIIIRFATIDCVKSGWMYKQKRSWYITDEGKQAYQLYSTDPEGFYKEATRLYNLWKSNQPQAETSEEPITNGQEEIKQVSITYENAEEQAWKDIKNHIHHMHPYEFQQMVAGLLRAMGYYVSWVAPPGRDGGIDIIAQGDPIGALPLRIKVQVKRQQSAIGVDGLRSFMAVLNDNDVGIFVSLGGFTKDAADEARYQEKRKITLIDLELLFDLWVQYYDKLTNKARLHMLLKPIHFLDPGED